MKVRPFFASMFLVAMMVLVANTVCAQGFPNKPIRLVTGAVGGGSDVTARFIAQGLAGSLGQPLIVENRGGNNLIPIEIVAKAPPDGYTLLVTGATFWLDPLFEKMPYDPVRDFLPLTLANSSPLLLVVHPSLPIKSVKELIAAAQAKPGELNFASGGGASSAYLAAELFKSMTGVRMTHIPYKGQGPATIDLLAGQVQLMFANAAAVAPHIKSGRLRVLAVTSPTPSALYPDLPTVASSGLPGYEAGSNTSLFVPAKTPPAIIRQLNQEIVRFLQTAETKERLLNMGVESVGSTPEELAAKVKSEIARVAKIIKDAGIKLD